MKVLYLVGTAAISAVMFSSCVCGLKNKELPATLAAGTDSLVVNDETGDYKMSVQTLSDNSLAVSKAVGEYVNETLGGDYDGNTDDFKSVIKYYFDEVVADAQEAVQDPPMKYTDLTSFSVYSEGPDYITYLYEKDEYKGGAHGGHQRYGMTFRKSDGRRIGWDVFTNKYDDDFHNMIKSGLKSFWKVDGDEQLKEYLMDENDIYSLPVPECPPLFTDEGIEFVYNQYEIAPYASGLPVFTVPYSKISEHMMLVAKKIVGIE